MFLYFPSFIIICFSNYIVNIYFSFYYIKQIDINLIINKMNAIKYFLNYHSPFQRLEFSPTFAQQCSQCWRALYNTAKYMFRHRAFDWKVSVFCNRAMAKSGCAADLRLRVMSGGPSRVDGTSASSQSSIWIQWRSPQNSGWIMRDASG